MAESQQKPWSSNPNAPQISNEMYLEEKIALVGNLSGAVFYGIDIFNAVNLLVFTSFVQPRDNNRFVLSMYRRIFQPGEGGNQMGTRSSHYGHVFDRDDIYRDRT